MESTQTVDKVELRVDPLVLKVCSSGMRELSKPQSSTDRRILVSARHNLGYCNVPKVGSSFWFATFGILEGNFNSTKSPDVLLEKLVENIQFKVGVKFYSEMSTIARAKLRDTGTMFLFVRNPYFRILSAYVNKFLSPNTYYWSTAGIAIIKSIRHRASANSLNCGHDVTFAEFLTFITRTRNLDHHWAPIYQLCSPCHYPYKFIGKAETLEHDTDTIIKRANISSFIDYDPNGDNQVKTYMTEKIGQFIHHYQSMNNCISFADLMRRLWECFKAKGYLPHDANPTELSFDMAGNNTDGLKQYMLEMAYTTYKHHVTSGGMSAYNDRFAADMYNSVPSDILNKIKDIFLPDFLLFGYDPEPNLLFGNRRNNFKPSMQ